MANAEQDFTFPATTATPPPCFFESPPLWQPVPRPERPESLQYGIGLGKFIKLCSCQECKASNKITLRESFRYDDDGGTEEKMDLLWEDLDEKFSRNPGRTDEENDENSSSPGKNEGVCCVKTLKLSKGNGYAFNGLKAGILVLIRFMMNKVFSMHNSGNSIKKLAW